MIFDVRFFCGKDGMKGNSGKFMLKRKARTDYEDY